MASEGGACVMGFAKLLLCGLALGFPSNIFFPVSHLACLLTVCVQAMLPCVAPRERGKLCGKAILLTRCYGVYYFILDKIF